MSQIQEIIMIPGSLPLSPSVFRGATVFPCLLSDKTEMMADNLIAHFLILGRE